MAWMRVPELGLPDPMVAGASVTDASLVAALSRDASLGRTPMSMSGMAKGTAGPYTGYSAPAGIFFADVSGRAANIIASANTRIVFSANSTVSQATSRSGSPREFAGIESADAGTFVMVSGPNAYGSGPHTSCESLDINTREKIVGRTNQHGPAREPGAQQGRLHRLWLRRKRERAESVAPQVPIRAGRWRTVPALFVSVLRPRPVAISVLCGFLSQEPYNLPFGHLCASSH
jgi:hypothetical protein